MNRLLSGVVATTTTVLAALNLVAAAGAAAAVESAEATPAVGTSAAPATPDLATRVDAAIDRALASRRIVGAVVLVAQDGRLVYRRAAGLADREAGTPMREDAIFLLASVTKPIVSVAALRLVEQGRLRLEDPVSRWLPHFRPRTAEGAAPNITVHHLLTHTAGLGYDFMQPADGPYRRLGVSNGLDRPGPSLDENLRRIARAPLAYTPGDSWGYSMATDVLGAVVAKAAGQDLPAAVRRLVTAPLQMDDTRFSVVDRGRLVAHYADGQPAPVRMQGLQAVGFHGATVNFAPGRLLDRRAYPSGGAGMAGTAGDVLRFLETVRAGGGPLLRPETVALMAKAHVGAEARTEGPGWGFGYGWGVLLDPAAARSPQSAGTLQWGGAYGHKWFIDPQRRLTVVALTNTTFEGMAGVFTTDLRDAVYGAGTPAEAR